MGTFNVTSSTINSQFDYKETNIVVIGNFVKNGSTGDLQSVQGGCYRNENGDAGAYFGSFTGAPGSDGEVQYDLSSMRRQDSNLVWDAIDEIEPHIIGNQNGDN